MTDRVAVVTGGSRGIGSAVAERLLADGASVCTTARKADALIETEFAGALYDDRKDEITATYPLGRIGRPDDVTSAISFLVSEQSGWITGETLLLDRGLPLTSGF